VAKLGDFGSLDVCTDEDKVVDCGSGTP